MSSAWIHIITVHLPVIGIPLLLYFVVRSQKKETSDKIWKQIYSFLILLAIITTISYFTGPTTADWLKNHLEEYPQNIVENHALWGRVAFTVQFILGVLGIMGWSSILQEEQPSRKLHFMILILLILNTVVIIYTAHLGGMIRRPDLF